MTPLEPLPPHRSHTPLFGYLVGDLVAVLSLGLKYAFVSTCGFPLTMWLLQVWIYKPLHTPLLCGREAELKIGRFGGSEQPALCEALKNTLRSIGILFAYHLYVSIINLNVKRVTVAAIVKSTKSSCVIVSQRNQ